jgi:hypothetical protein
LGETLTHRNHQSRGDELLSQLLGAEGPGERVEIRLLHEFQGGYTLERLRSLLLAEGERAVTVGAWIASELGKGATPLLEDVVGLLQSPFFKVRFSALDVVLVCAEPKDKRAIALAVDLVDDPHPAVVWQALVFLASAPEALLRAVPKPSVINERVAVHRKGLGLLLRATSGSGASDVASALESDDPLLRRYAAAAACKSPTSGLLTSKSCLTRGDRRFGRC